LGMDFVRIEPQAHGEGALIKAGARNIAEVDPRYTQILDLTQSEAELRAGLASGHRNLINGTQRRGIVIRQTDKPGDLAQMLAMLSDTAQRSEVTFYPPDYFHTLWNTLQPRDAIRLYIAEVESKPIAGALFYDWGDTRYYAHAGAYQDKNRKAKASVSLVWQAILDAKAAGLKTFDLWGIAPADNNQHHLATLSRFKTAFGGSQASYGGTWDISLNRVKYAAYTAYRTLRGRG
jgi:lipid II:glycine glycyltransferase (peptidoglycan interpeptide bridge formation enzyme)